MTARLYILNACAAGALLLTLFASDVYAQPATSAEAVKQEAEQMLASRFSEGTARVKVRVRRTGGEIDGAVPLRLDFPRRDGALPEGLAQVQVKAREAGRWQKTGWALLYVAHFDSVVTAGSRIRSGEAVTPNRVSVAWTETTDLRGEPLRAADFRTQAASGEVVATRMLRAGRVLQGRDVRAPYAVDIGTAIEMNYTRGRIAFRLSCKAREPGFAQEAVRLYCPGTRNTYRARLTGEQEAKWIETL